MCGEPLDLPVGETGTRLDRAGPVGLEAVLKFEIFSSKKEQIILARLFLTVKIFILAKQACLY